VPQPSARRSPPRTRELRIFVLTTSQHVSIHPNCLERADPDEFVARYHRSNCLDRLPTRSRDNLRAAVWRSATTD
jgi:hypothetical protein